MDLFVLCAVGLLFASGACTTNSCDSPSPGTEVDGSTTSKDEGVTFLDQLNGHSGVGEGSGSDGPEELDDSAAIWLPETFDHEESPLEVDAETVTSAPAVQVPACSRDLAGEGALSHGEKPMPTKRTLCEGLRAEDEDVSRFREKKDLSIPSRSPGAEEANKTNWPPKSSSGPPRKILTNPTSPTSALPQPAISRRNSSQEAHESNSETPVNRTKPNGSKQNSRENALKYEDLNNRVSSIEIISEVPEDSEKVMAKKIDQGVVRQNVVTARVVNTNDHAQVSLEGQAVPETEVHSLKVNTQEYRDDKDPNRDDIPYHEGEKVEGSLADLRSQADVKCDDEPPGRAGLRSDVSSGGSSKTASTTSGPKFEKQSMTLDLFAGVPLRGGDAGVPGGMAEVVGWEVHTGVVARNTNTSSVPSGEHAEAISDEAGVGGGPQGDEVGFPSRLVAQVDREDETESQEHAEEVGDEAGVGGGPQGDEVGLPSRLVAQVDREDDTESQESSWSHEIRKEQVETVGDEAGVGGGPQGDEVGLPSRLVAQVDREDDTESQESSWSHKIRKEHAEAVGDEAGVGGGPQGGEVGLPSRLVAQVDREDDTESQESSWSHKIRKEHAEAVGDEAGVGGGPQGGEVGLPSRLVAQVDREDDTESQESSWSHKIRKEHAEAVGDEAGVGGGPQGGEVGLPSRLVAQVDREDETESQESSWSQRTRAEHAEVISRFLPAKRQGGTSSDRLPAITAAQFQRRPSRLSGAPPELKFPDVPEGDTFHVQELGLSDGVFIFSYLGSFLSLLQPSEFPIELIRDALWKRVSVVSLISQSLKVEAGFIACLVLGMLVAMSLPCYVVVHTCCAKARRESQQSGDGDWSDGDSSASDCRKRALLFVLHVLVLFIGIGVGAMFATNEQMAGALGQTPRVLHTALTDANTFLRNSNRQLRTVITDSLDRALMAASEDLENVEELLGEPIQNELAVETGVDVALDALVDVGTAAVIISSKVGFMLAYCAETRDLVSEASGRLQDLRQQVESFRRQCPSRDRPLCETVDPNGLDASMRLQQLLDDRRLTEIHDLKEANLSSLAQQVRSEFQKIPQHVEEQTREARIAVRRQLARQRAQVDDEAWALDAVTRDLAARVESARESALLLVRGLAELEYWRWFAGLGASLAVLVMWVLMLAGLVCGCCGAEKKAAPTLLASVVVASLLSVVLWMTALSSLLVGGHGEVFVCRPLYDEPEFPALTGLLDRPGVVFQRGGGFLSNLLYGNDTLDVPLREVLMECQDNRPTYKAFRLRSVYDVSAASDHRTWDTLHDDLSRLQVNLTDLQLLTPDLQRQLTSLVASSTVNLTMHRAQLSRQVTGKDLSSFADQLESVANQIKDLATASRMETLASRTRRLVVSHIQPLEQRKEDLVYQLTALEVQMQPLQRQVNQSLSHLKTIQYFINNQGDSISKQKAKDYVRRLLGYVDQYRDHVMRSTGDHVAPCKPVWDVYHAVRQLLCRHILDPLNGFWFSCMWCLVMFLVATPLCLKLAELCKEGGDRGGFLQRGNSDSPSEALMLPECNTWSSNNRGQEPDGW